MTESSLYERLGGAFAIAAVVDHFSDAIVKNPIVGQTSENPALREWHTNNLERLPGLKFMRTLWVCEVAGGPQQYAATQPGRPAITTAVYATRTISSECTTDVIQTSAVVLRRCARTACRLRRTRLARRPQARHQGDAAPTVLTRRPPRRV